MKPASLILKILDMIEIFMSKHKARKLSNALKKAKKTKNTSDLERIYDPNKLPNKTDKERSEN